MKKRGLGDFHVTTRLRAGRRRRRWKIGSAQITKGYIEMKERWQEYSGFDGQEEKGKRPGLGGRSYKLMASITSKTNVVSFSDAVEIAGTTSGKCQKVVVSVLVVRTWFGSGLDLVLDLVWTF